jgi:hypothetical protein
MHRAFLIAATCALVVACGGGGGSGSDDPGVPQPSPAPDSARGPDAGGATTCSRNSAIATDSCEELGRIGAVAKTHRDISNLMFDARPPKLQSVLDAGGRVSCPNGGTLSVSRSSSNGYEADYSACNFGLGEVSGQMTTSLTNLMNNLLDYRVDFSVEAAGFLYEGASKVRLNSGSTFVFSIEELSAQVRSDNQGPVPVAIFGSHRLRREGNMFRHEAGDSIEYRFNTTKVVRLRNAPEKVPAAFPVTTIDGFSLIGNASEGGFDYFNSINLGPVDPSRAQVIEGIITAAGDGFSVRLSEFNSTPSNFATASSTWAEAASKPVLDP